MDLGRSFVTKSAASAAGAPGEAVEGIEKWFQSWDTGGYYADCLFETWHQLDNNIVTRYGEKAAVG